MAQVLPVRPNTNSSSGTSASVTSGKRRPSHTSFPSSKRLGSQDESSQQHRLSAAHRRNASSTSQGSYQSSRLPAASQSRNVSPPNIEPPPLPRQKAKVVQSQYPADSTEKHVEYILVASFDIDRGSVMEHQYPSPVGGDEHMLAELMLPDQAHVRSQDWTIFFLHKDAAVEEEGEGAGAGRRKKRRGRGEGQVNGGAEMSGSEEDESEEEEEEEEESGEEDGDVEMEHVDGPPLVYVLNLVNTKQDNSVKRGAIVKAMAICTRHPFLHIYKPLLLLALQQYFAKPVMETLASLYDAVNSMDLSLMPRLSYHEKTILQSSDAKDLFLEKFEAIVAQRMASKEKEHGDALSPPSPTTAGQGQGGGASRGRFGLPRDTHEFDSVVKYANVPVPVKIPVALSPETVGDFSLVKLITTFSTPHTTTPQPFNPTHPHLTTSGPLTPPMIVLLNAMLTQKRVVFLGHNLPSSDVAEAVLGACALASGGLLRGFTRHAFPYTDLTKIDDLLKVPGFIAGVTNPAFAHKSEWWDLLCDLSTGRMKISNRIEQAPLTEGVVYFHQNPSGTTPMNPAGGISAIAAAGGVLSAGLGGNIPTSGGDDTGDAAFMANVLQAIHERHGENAVRSKFRRWVLKFTRVAASFEEVVYGASNLHIHHGPTNNTVSPKTGGAQESPSTAPTSKKAGAGEENPPPEISTGHGYVWPTPQSKTHELAANATRIEGWRNTRSYYNFIQDLAAYYSNRPVKDVDLQHLHDKLAKLRLGHEGSGNVYLAICAAVRTDGEVAQLLSLLCSGTSADWKVGGGAAGGGVGGGGTGFQGQQGLFYLALGLFHPRLEVREAVAELLARVRGHEAGRHFWRGLGRFARMGWERVLAGREERLGGGGGGAEE